MSMNQVPVLFHMSNTFEGASVNVKLDSGAYNEQSSVLWIFLFFFPPPTFLITQGFTSFQLSDSVLHP